MANEMLECSIDYFLDHYEPFVPSTESISDASQTLKSFNTDQRLATPKIHDSGEMAWTDQHAEVQTSAKRDATDGAVFLLNVTECLRTIECLEHNNGTDKPRTCNFFYKNFLPKTEIPGTELGVDACLASDKYSPDVVISDMAVIVEVKGGTEGISAANVST